MNPFLTVSSAFLSEQSLVLVADILVKATALLLLAIVVNVFLRRRSAALRHRIWSLVFCGLLGLPVLATLLPSWRLPILPAVVEAPVVDSEQSTGAPAAIIESNQNEQPGIAKSSLPIDTTIEFTGSIRAELAQMPAVEFDASGEPATINSNPAMESHSEDARVPLTSRASAEPESNPGSRRFVLYAFWGLGFLLAAWPLVIGFIRNAALRRGANSVDDGFQSTGLQRLRSRLGLHRQVHLLETGRSIVPITWGILRPVILFPVAWREWTDARRELVLLHELAHVKRLDVAWQIVARFVCAIYWFHPLSWYALRRLRIERELACDDCVLMSGARPSDYARELVEMARSYHFLVLPTSVAMAQTTNLEQRVKSLLDLARSHMPVGRFTGRLLLVAAVAVVTGVAMVRPTAKATDPLAEPQTDVVKSDVVAEVIAEYDDGGANAVGEEAPDETLQYEGRVVDQNRQPVPSANLVLVYWSRSHFGEVGTMPLGTTDDQGQFKFTSKRSDFSFDDEETFYSCQLIAVADGYGFGKGASIAFESTGRAASHSELLTKAFAKAREQNPRREIQLVHDDVPIVGRVVSTEGKGVEGVRVRVDRLWFNESGSLDSWETASKADRADFYSLRNETPLSANGQHLPLVIPDVYTDKDGRFVIRGIGRERVVQLLIGGAGVEAKMVKTRTRAGKKIQVPKHWRSGDRPDNKEVYYAAEFTHVAGPSKPVIGRITDADTGEPIPSVLIAAGASTTFTRLGEPWINTTTDAEGRYRLEGLPVGDRESIYMQPQSTTAYLPAGAQIQTKTDGTQIERDFQLKKGIWVRGITVDDRTGKRLSGSLQYFADLGNELLEAYPQFSRAAHHERRSSPNGQFAIAVPPGRGVLTFIPDDHGSYQRGVGSTGITIPADGERDLRMYRTLPSYLMSTNYAVYREINPAVDSAPLELTLAPTSGIRVTGKLLDPGGKRITDGLVVMADDSLQPASYDEDENLFSVDGYYPDTARQLLFFHLQRNLAGYLKLQGEAPEDLSVTLEPAAAIRGRLVDDSGAPMSGVRLFGQQIPGKNNGISELRLVTDDEGKFLIRGLVPGLKYTVSASGNGIRGDVLVDASVPRAGTRNVGTVQLKPRESSSAESLKAEDSRSVVVHGTVRLPDGSAAAAGATVWMAEQAIPKNRWNQEFLLTKWKRLAKSQDDGSFQCTIEVDPDSEIRIATTATGFGWVWKDVNAADLTNPVDLRLVDDFPIEGRILSLDGKPAVGVTLTVNHLRGTSSESTLDEIIRATVGSSGIYTNSPSPPFNGGGPEFTAVVTDADGRFRIEGMGVNRSVRLEAFGGGIGASRFRILTRDTPEKVKPHGAVDVREGLAESTYFATFTHVAAPARTVRGTVSDKATGKPIPGVRISSQSSWHIMMNPVETDASGRYEITGLPKMEKYRPLIFDPPGTRHFNKEVRITDTAGLQPITLDVTLATGISVKGTLTDRETGQPLSGIMTYSPLYPNEDWRTIGDPDAANPAAMSVIGEDGTYEIPVLPGPGALTARTTANGYVPPKIDLERLQELTTDIIEDTRGGVTALSAHTGEQTRGLIGMFDKHALELINPARGATQLTIDLTAIRGRSLRGTILDDEGQPLVGAKASGLGPGTDSDAAMTTADFTVTNLAPSQKRWLYFHHPERDLGAAVVVDGQPSEPLTVRMLPTGKLKLRFVDRLGEPLPDIEVEVRGGWTSWHHTDADGRLEVSDIISNTEYRIRAKPARQRGPSLYVDEATVSPGQTLDMGTFTRKNQYQYKPIGNSKSQPETMMRPGGDRGNKVD